MAKKLKDYDFTETKYPWSEWLDGSIWELEHGSDFETKMETFRTQVYTSAKKRGLKARVATDGTKLILQAFEPNGSSKE